MLTKQQILEALRRWINQRPGLEFGNYGEWNSYRSELRSITRDRRDALELLQAVTWRDSISAEDLIAAFPRAFSGRLTLAEVYQVNGRGELHATLESAKEQAAKYLPAIVEIRALAKLSYCTGQYWPTEYRKAAAAVLSSVLWDYARSDMPKPDGKKITRKHGTFETEHESIEGLTPGNWLRRYFRREFGRSIQSRWFS